MKVKCIGVYNSITGSRQASNDRLTIDKEYVVFEVSACIQKGVSYCLVGDNENGSPAIYSAAEFEIISDYVPTNWALLILKNGMLVNGPSAWHRPGFWEECYDYIPEAMEIYRREAIIMTEEEDAL